MKGYIETKDTFIGEIIVLNLTIFFYLFRTSIPFLKYPFLILYIGFVIYSFARYYYRAISAFKEFTKNYSSLFFLVAILIISFLVSSKLYLIIFKDIVNAVILLSFFYIMSFYIIIQKDLSKFIHYLYVQIILFALLISLTIIFNVLNIFQDIDIYTFFGITADPNYTVDYNFEILPSILGIVVVLYFLIKRDSFQYKIIYNFLLIIYSFSIFLSGSRRGLILLIVIICLLVLVQLLRLFSRKIFFKKLGSKSYPFLLSIFILVISSWYIIFFASNAFKNKTLEIAGSKNLLNTKIKVTNIIRRYATIVEKSVSFSDLYNILWTPVFNSKDPESSWGTKIHKNVFPLIGPNVEIVPSGAKGYLMDSTCNGFPESTYCESYSLITELKVDKGDRYKASVYCFVSEEFDGDVVRITIPLVSIINNIVYGNTTTNYDLNSKGIWKKLEIDFNCNTGTVPIYISFSKIGVQDFCKLKGYVIFAYPNFQIIEKKDSITNNSENNFGILKNTMEGDYHEGHNYQLSDSNLKNSRFNSNESLIGRNYCDIMPSFLRRHNIAEIFPFIFSFTINPLVETSNSDPIRSWASNFISEDTTYYPYKANIVLDTISNQLSESRLVRWQFAFQIYTKEYNWQEKIFGSGFDHLNWYGFYFLKDKTKSDYPHNPFLSVLLYSGIIGLIVYLLFIYKVFYYYIKYFKEYNILSIFFIITFFFSFISAGNPFDPPIMGFLVILPFFIHSIHKKEIKSNAATKTEA